MRAAGPIFIWAVALAVLAAFCIRVPAQGGPPMITDDTETIPKGHFEINTAFTVERGADGRIFEIPLVDSNYGLSDNMQIKVELPWLALHANGQPALNGLGNTNIGVRWRFRDERDHHRVALSIYPALEFNNPTSSVRRGLTDKGPEFLLPLQWQTKVGKFGLNGDVGYRFKRGTDEVIYGVVLGREFGEGFELLGEMHGEGPRDNAGQQQLVYNLGTRIRLTSHLNLLFSAGKSLIRNRDPRFINYTGIQITF